MFARRISHDGVLVLLVALARAFFGQANGFDDFERVHGQLFLAQSASTFSNAPRVKTTLSLRRFVGVQRIAGGDFDVRDVAGGERQILIVRLGDDQRGAFDLQGRQHADEILWSLADASLKSSTTITSPALMRSVSALRKASCLVECETFLLKSRGLGRKPRHRHATEANGTNRRERGRCPFVATASCSCRRLRPRSWCKRCPCVGPPVGDHGVVDGLGAFAVFDQRELHFEFALAFTFNIFNL